MYLLNDKIEHIRLDEQNSMEVYSVENELKGITISETDYIMDAGCGHGAITDELIAKGAKSIIGVDGSSERIRNYEIKYELSPHIEGVVSDLETLPFKDNEFDKIFCRFVLHHQVNPADILKEYIRVLRPGGKLIIIDSDGILFNVYNINFDFTKEFELLKDQLPMDMMIGRKIKSHLSTLGLSKIHSKIIPMHFTGNQLSDERKQYISRFDSMSEVLQTIMGKNKSNTFINTDNFSVQFIHRK